MRIKILPGEAFYGGAVTEGPEQPYTAQTCRDLDLSFNHSPNQQMPLLISTAGRWLWRSEGLRLSFCEGYIDCPDDTVLGSCPGGLREAYHGAMAQCFPFHEIRLDPSLFAAPVYNTWIELTFHQTQEGVRNYAQAIRSEDMPAGVLMIDDGWTDYYGRWQFSAAKFPRPQELLAELHDWGFKVMLWICPFVTPDTLEYRELERRGLLVLAADGQPHIAHWWNGWSAVLDLCKEEAVDWLRGQLAELQAMGVDGFKFDAGDSFYYPLAGDRQSRAWAAFGEGYSLNEFRVTTGAEGWSLMQRLCDKDHSWAKSGLTALIPSSIVQNLTGHPFCSPDLIGGGEYRNFYEQERLDEELVLRWAQVACLMPVMQFSAAPWRILSPPYYQELQSALALRRRYAQILLDTVEDCRRTGEPILRPLAYHYSEPEALAVRDAYLLGSEVLVAPILEKGQTGRSVYLPAGCWEESRGRIYQSRGERFWVETGLGLAVFQRRQGD